MYVCDPSEFICGSPVPSARVLGGGAFGRLLGHEAGALVHVSGVLVRRNIIELILLCLVRYSKKMTVCKPESWSW